MFFTITLVLVFLYWRLTVLSRIDAFLTQFTRMKEKDKTFISITEQVSEEEGSTRD